MRLFGLLFREGIALPAPEVDVNPEATLDLIWFDRRSSSSLGFTVLEPGAVEGRYWMHVLDGDRSLDIYDPSDEDIVREVKRFAG